METLLIAGEVSFLTIFKHPRTSSLIKQIDLKAPGNSELLHALFQVSYAVEAELLKAENFPPLSRTQADFLTSETEFFAFWKEEAMAGAVELYRSDKHLHIQSLVVDPRFFRQGIGRQLMEFVLATMEAPLYMVETGKDNGPARMLYVNLGFNLVDDWMTDIGVRKVRFELPRD